MKALKLKSSSKENPIFGYVLWTDEDMHGSIYIEGILESDGVKREATTFNDSWDKLNIVNDTYTKEADLWEFVNIKITIE